MYPDFKYQTLYTCIVPDNYKTIKSFHELISSDDLPSDDIILQTIRMSFESAGVPILQMSLSNDQRLCEVLIDGENSIIQISIRSKPSLVIGDKIFQLEEFNI